MRAITRFTASQEPVVIFWFRRDLRTEDNRGLAKAAGSGHRVLPLFVFDTDILDRFDKDHPAVTVMCKSLADLDSQIRKAGSALIAFIGTTAKVIQHLVKSLNVSAVYANEDFEPEGKRVEGEVRDVLRDAGVPLHLSTDHLIFRPGKIVKDDGTPYRVYGHFRRRWLKAFESEAMSPTREMTEARWFKPVDAGITRFTPKIAGFQEANTVITDPLLNRERLLQYQNRRDYPAADGTTRAGQSLRFGTISIRKITGLASRYSKTLLDELIWREFFMNILFHFPHAESGSFKQGYSSIRWRNSEDHFMRWCEGTTGFPLVDAGMRELKETGYMHNRVRMITASFLTKNLLTDWQWGEAWFASRLSDFELSSNNGNWQWVAGTGCDAAPYFRVFSPAAQQIKFDRRGEYTSKWVPEAGSDSYPAPIIDEKQTRKAAVEAYREALSKYKGERSNSRE